MHSGDDLSTGESNQQKSEAKHSFRSRDPTARSLVIQEPKLFSGKVTPRSSSTKVSSAGIQKIQLEQ